jgi:hypothetical protein
MRSSTLIAIIVATLFIIGWMALLWWAMDNQ